MENLLEYELIQNGQHVMLKIYSDKVLIVEQPHDPSNGELFATQEAAIDYAYATYGETITALNAD